MPQAVQPQVMQQQQQAQGPSSKGLLGFLTQLAMQNWPGAAATAVGAATGSDLGSQVASGVVKGMTGSAGDAEPTSKEKKNEAPDTTKDPSGQGLQAVGQPTAMAQAPMPQAPTMGPLAFGPTPVGSPMQAPYPFSAYPQGMPMAGPAYGFGPQPATPWWAQPFSTLM